MSTSVWVQSELARIEREASELTPEDMMAVAEKFRTEIGGVYEYVAAHIEAVAK